MTERRSYRQGDLAALMALYRGSCYWPTCDEPVVRFVGKRPISNLQIAHIRAVSRGGPRFDAALSLEERNSFANLILLCHPHHSVVDKLYPDRYSVEMLEKWKASRESHGQEALQGLRSVTEDRLQQLLTDSLAEANDRLDRAITQLEELDFEAAEVMRTLVPTVETALMLQDATRRLRWLPEAAETLSRVARQLRWLPDVSEQLKFTARSLEKSRRFMER